jgi:hypothetical protein
MDIRGRVVLAVTLLDNASGLKAKNFRNTKLDDRGVALEEGAYLLDENYLVLRKNRHKLIMVSRRRVRSSDGSEAVLTWIGLYSAAPRQYDQREGFYCGVGVWLLNEAVSGEEVLRFLRGALERLYSSMEGRRITSEWRVEDVKLSDVGIGELEFSRVITSERPLSLGQGIGDDLSLATCFFDCSRHTSDEELAACISKAQTDLAFRRFNRVFIATSEDIVKELRRRGRASEVPEKGERLPRNGERFNPDGDALVLIGDVASSARDDEVTAYRRTSEVDGLRELRKELKILEGKVKNNDHIIDQRLVSIRRLLITILALFCVGLVFAISYVLAPTVFRSSAVEEIVGSLEHASRSVGLSGTQPPPAVSAGGAPQPDGPLEMEVENSSTNDATFPNSKESEARLEELSYLIDKVSPSLAGQKYAALRRVLDQARKQLETLRAK